MRSIRSTAVRLSMALCLLAFVGCHDINSVIPDPAEAGQDISIAGGGFRANQGASDVLYDGTSLSVVSWSDTVIVATLPASKTDGTYELQVVVGQDAESTFHTIENPPAGMVLVPEGLFLMGSESGGSDEA